MIRKQLYLDEGLERDLKTVARRSGESEAAHVRRALRTYLDAQLYDIDGDDDDPLLELVGLAGDVAAPADLARNHDRYLYGADRPTDAATG
ncbi:MAG: ribbon-helix-helix domain-containing protein [Actinobacteria bacterium]|nr:ribbon-helix-helix domain-containing protein [Actinomycetota bacterium]